MKKIGRPKVNVKPMKANMFEMNFVYDMIYV
jgi:hypothetical protein